ncbi:MAG: hypothetical protein Q7J69_06950 [Candidatus Omnitrophota bacterium]|nr:hypothetical protein [Candidatus Omnitrophota bacterium]
MRTTPLRAMEEINSAFLRIPKEEVRRLLERRDPLSIKHGMSMFTSKGKPRVIDVQMRPWVLDAAQKRFFHRACRLLRGALARVMPLYLADPAVRRILPLEPLEHEWLLQANAGGVQRPQAVLDRLDSTATFACSDWKDNFWFLEPNSVGIGGVHYIQATCELTKDWVIPSLHRALPDLSLVFPDDIREILFKLMARHARAIGRKLRRVVLLEDQSVNEGTDEFSSVARQFNRWGVQAVTADPREIVARGGELWVRGKPVDLFYRDTEITELFEMAGKKTRLLDGMREAFLRNQMVSSIAGEFDHKSAWELFTNPEFSRHFTLRQKNLFRKHVLWTRLLWQRKTTDHRGKTVDLFPYARRNRETLVVKPNRMYGGEGVYFGHQMTQSAWERQLDRTARKPGTHVVQQATQVRAELFPVASRDGRVRLEPFYAVTGFVATRDGLAVLGRSSKESVVNVSRHGGLIAIWSLG